MTNYFVIKEANGSNIILTNQNGQDMKSNLNTVQNAMQSADEFKKEEKLNQTDLINIVLNNPRTAMSIYFQKQDSAKAKKVYEAEMNDWANKLKVSLVDNGVNGSMTLLEAKPDKVTPGEMRLIKGYYMGSQDERGRFNFTDMEDPKKLIKGVDPRTVSFVIVNNVKYSIK